jgi:hypothetical protein
LVRVLLVGKSLSRAFPYKESHVFGLRQCFPFLLQLKKLVAHLVGVIDSLSRDSRNRLEAAGKEFMPKMNLDLDPKLALKRRLSETIAFDGLPC